MIISESLGSVGHEEYIWLSLINKDGKDFINLYFHKSFNINMGDKVFILLENGHIMKYDITNDPNKRNKGYYETAFQLLALDLKMMMEVNLNKMRLENIKTGEAFNYEINIHSETIKKLGPIEFIEIPSKIMVLSYLVLVQKEVENYQPLEILDEEENNESPSNNEQVYVYLMKDTANGYYKIGISNKPKYREKTLQSEKPTIEMICSKKFPNRKLASSIEQTLHQNYSEKRTRGEWFDLIEQDVNDLKQVLS